MAEYQTSPRGPCRRRRGCSTICLPIDKERYQRLVACPGSFRAWLDEAFRNAPELFPAAFKDGYRLKDSRVSSKQGLVLRRIECKSTGESFSVRPSFVLPYLSAECRDAEKVLYLRCYGVPFHALAHVFGKDSMHWYRLWVSLGRNSIVGTTVRKADLPEHLLADEHHRSLNGDKVYVATTVAAGCCLGAAVSPSADEKGLTRAYGVFKEEAGNVDPDWKPETVTGDGWKATRLTWVALYPTTVVLLCFLHGWLKIRDRAKHLGRTYLELGRRVWNCYRARDKRCMRQQLRRTLEWARKNTSGYVLEQVEKLWKKGKEYAKTYDHPGCHRTSNKCDRVMREMQRYFEDGQHLHGSIEAANLHARAWALAYNFAPWSKRTTKANKGYRSPAERLNRHCYHDNWLENLLVSASLAGFRR